MHEGGELLGWLHSRKQGDSAARGQAFCGGDLLRVAKLYVLTLHVLDEAFTIAGDIAFDIAEGGQFFAFGLADILSRDLRPSLCAPVGFREWCTSR